MPSTSRASKRLPRVGAGDVVGVSTAACLAARPDPSTTRSRPTGEVDESVAAVLAADAELEPARDAFSTPMRPSHVDRLERADAEDALLEVGGEERRLDVVAGEAPGGLGEVVGAEGEELGGFGDLVGGQRRARQFDHRADEELEVHAGLGCAPRARPG